jgi:hypothetical protein
MHNFHLRLFLPIGITAQNDGFTETGMVASISRSVRFDGNSVVRTNAAN